MKKKKKLEDSIRGFVIEEDEKPSGTTGEADDNEENYEVDLDDELPFACLICRSDFKNPVVTLCGHYFCSKCATENHRKNSKCSACEKQTFGVFNVAHKLNKQIAIRDNALTENGKASAVPVSVGTKRGTWE